MLDDVLRSLISVKHPKTFLLFPSLMNNVWFVWTACTTLLGSRTRTRLGLFKGGSKHPLARILDTDVTELADYCACQWEHSFEFTAREFFWLQTKFQYWINSCLKNKKKNLKLKFLAWPYAPVFWVIRFYPSHRLLSRLRTMWSELPAQPTSNRKTQSRKKPTNLCTPREFLQNVSTMFDNHTILLFWL